MKTKLTIEQSKRLIELGVDKSLADIVSANEPYYPDDVEFSLGALFSILPKKITDRRKVYNLQIEISDCLDADDKWCILYRNSLGIDELDSFQSAEELIDAIYNILVWLKENKIQEL